MNVAITITNEDSFPLHQQLLEQLPLGLFQFVVFVDGTRTFTYVSEGFERIFGIPSKDILGNFELVHAHILEEHRITFDYKIQHSIETGDSLFHTFTLCIESKGMFHLEVRAHVQILNEGHTQFSGTFLDITQQKLSEERLREEHIRLQNIIEGTKVGTWECNLQTGEAIVDEQWAAILGYSVADLSPTHVTRWESLLHPDDIDIAQKALLQHSTNEISLYDQEVRMRKKDGSYLWVQGRGKIISWDADATPQIMYGTLVDISERKKSEQELYKAKQEFELYFFTSLDLLCIATTDGTFIRLNPEWEKVLGYSIQELEGSQFLSYVHPEDVSDTISAISTLQDQLEVTSFINRYRRKDGTYRWIEWRSKPIGQTIYAVARDVSDHIELQKTLSDRRNYVSNDCRRSY